MKSLFGDAIFWLMAGILSLTLLINCGNTRPINWADAIFIVAMGPLLLVPISIVAIIENSPKTSCAFNCPKEK